MTGSLNQLNRISNAGANAGAREGQSGANVNPIPSSTTSPSDSDRASQAADLIQEYIRTVLFKNIL